MNTAERLDKIGELLIEDEGADSPEPITTTEVDLDPEVAMPSDEMNMTFTESVIDVLFENDGTEEAEELIKEMLLWVELTDDADMLKTGLDLVAGLRDGIEQVQKAIDEKLSE